MESVELRVLKDLKQKYKDFFEIKYIVGSFARGDFNSKSDIDIVYSLNKNVIENMDVFEIFNILNNIAKKYMKDKIYV